MASEAGGRGSDSEAAATAGGGQLPHGVKCQEVQSVRRGTIEVDLDRIW